MPYPGLIYWGVFLACGLVLMSYTAWMFWVERRPNEGGDIAEAGGTRSNPEPVDLDSADLHPVDDAQANQPSGREGRQ